MSSYWWRCASGASAVAAFLTHSVVLAGPAPAPSPSAEGSAECDGPGRIDPEGSGERILRGFVVAWAVNDDNEEIRFNHLSGAATIIHYSKGTAMEYEPWAFQSVNPNIVHGQQTGTPGTINLDGVEFGAAYDFLLLNFTASGSTALSSPGFGTLVGSDTDLTLHPASLDVRNVGEPVITKAIFDVWNENEQKFSGANQCVTCWNQTLLSDYGFPNHFTVATLQTEFGKARMDGVAGSQCPGSVNAAILGVANRQLEIMRNTSKYASTIAPLIGMGEQSAVIQYTPTIDESPDGRPAFLGRRAASTPAPVALGALGLAGGGENNEDDGMALGGAVVQDVGTASDKGSVLYFSDVEIRWAGTNLVQDTLISLTNDYPQAVKVQLYFVNGDEPGLDPGCPQENPGWNFYDNEIQLTANQPIIWSAATGQGTLGPISPFTILDP